MISDMLSVNFRPIKFYTDGKLFWSRIKILQINFQNKVLSVINKSIR